MRPAAQHMDGEAARSRWGVGDGQGRRMRVTCGRVRLFFSFPFFFGVDVIMMSTSSLRVFQSLDEDCRVQIICVIPPSLFLY